MVAHPLHKRQLGVAAPTGAGITNTALTVGTEAATATSLAFDSSAGSGSNTAPPIAISYTPVVHTTPSASASDSNSATPSSSVAASSSTSSPIALSTVVGTCIGAFIGASALIILGVWFYRRYSRSLKQRYIKTRAPIPNGRNARVDEQRRRSRLEPWTKLEDGDKWGGPHQTKEVDVVSPMEKLTMFKKRSPSVRTAFTHVTHKSDDAPFDFVHPFSQYHPSLAKDLASDEKGAFMPEPRPFLGRVDANATISWEAESAKNTSFLSAHTARMEGGAMSPTLNMALPTPAAVKSEPHRWESAEVVHFSEGQSAEIIDPAEEESSNRRSAPNPFFNAQEYGHQRSHSKSSSRSRSRSNSVSKQSHKGKDRERIVSMDPFSDPLPKPSFVYHHATTSSASSASNERAIQSLKAVLDVSEEEIQSRLRVASMQPSVISAMYGDDEVTEKFPIPPSSAGHSIKD